MASDADDLIGKYIISYYATTTDVVKSAGL